MDYKEKVIALLNSQELSQEQKEKLESIFPELKESKDERVRKELIKVFSNREKYLIDQSFGDITVSEALAWLEKQGERKEATCVAEIIDHLTEKEQEILFKELEMQKEQKPAWSEEDENILKDIITDVKFEGYNNDMQANSYKKINWLKSLKERYTWKPSKGHMKALNTCIMQGEISYVGQGTELQSLYNDLKKLTE